MKIIVLGFKRDDFEGLVDEFYLHYDCNESYDKLDRNSCLERYGWLFAQLFYNDGVFFNSFFYVLDLMKRKSLVKINFDSVVYRLNRYFAIYKNVIILYNEGTKYKHILDMLNCNKICVHSKEEVLNYIKYK